MMRGRKVGVNDCCARKAFGENMFFLGDINEISYTTEVEYFSFAES